jgi:hypothetical protein
LSVKYTYVDVKFDVEEKVQMYVKTVLAVVLGRNLGGGGGCELCGLRAGKTNILNGKN